VAKTNAEIQKSFRDRSELKRVDLRIQPKAKQALDFISKHFGISQQESISALILRAEIDINSKTVVCVKNIRTEYDIELIALEKANEVYINIKKQLQLSVEI